jgi:putative spermidine/putrescine transport system substrate-binding protein
MSRIKLTRRTMLAGTALASAGLIAAPAITGAQEANTLRITHWGGRWGELMRTQVIPPFEQANRCRIEGDTSFPFIPKLQSSPRNRPIYDVLHTNSNEHWQAFEMGLVDRDIPAAQAPNLADLFPYATNRQFVVGVIMFTSAIGLAYRPDKGPRPTSWKDFWEARYANQRGSYIIPINSIGQAFLMMAGKVYGSGMRDLDAGYRAMERLRGTTRMVDFTGVIENQLQSGELAIGVLHDTAAYRHTARGVEFSAPSEGVMILDQTLSLTSGGQKKELAAAFVNHMLSLPVQKLLAEDGWYSPTNRRVELAAQYREKLLVTEAQVASLIQLDWQWYNARKDEIDDRINRIFRN